MNGRLVAILTIKDCFFVLLYYLEFKYASNYASLVWINIMGNSNFNHITMSKNGQTEFCCSKLKLFYNETYTVSKHHTLRLNNFTVETIQVEMLQYSYKVMQKIINTKVQNNKYIDYAGINLISYGIF